MISSLELTPEGILTSCLLPLISTEKFLPAASAGLFIGVLSVILAGEPELPLPDAVVDRYSTFVPTHIS